MASPVTESCNFKNITSTTTVFTGRGGLLGIFVASVAGTPTIKVQDGSGTLVNTFTPVAATFYPMPGQFITSLVVTIGGTVDCTVFWGT
jgi:hypothetical protein